MPEHPARSAVIDGPTLRLYDAAGDALETVTLTQEPGDRSIYWPANRALANRGLVAENGWWNELGDCGLVPIADVAPESDVYGQRARSEY